MLIFFKYKCLDRHSFFHFYSQLSASVVVMAVPVSLSTRFLSCSISNSRSFVSWSRRLSSDLNWCSWSSSTSHSRESGVDMCDQLVTDEFPVACRWPRRCRFWAAIWLVGVVLKLRCFFVCLWSSEWLDEQSSSLDTPPFGVTSSVGNVFIVQFGFWLYSCSHSKSSDDPTGDAVTSELKMLKEWS